MRKNRVCCLVLSLSVVWSVSLVAIAQDATKGNFPQPPRKRKAPAPETVFVDGRNVLRNSGFEMGTDAWTLDTGHTLASDATSARSGNACVRGQVTEEKKALYLIQKVRVKKGAIYTYSVWARGTEGAKMTVFIVQPGQSAKTRRGVGAFTDIPVKWKEFTGRFTAEADGELALQLIAPSSFGAPPSTIWVDDVRLMEFAVSAPIGISNGDGFCDEPSLARAGDGSVYVSWLRFEDDRESVQVARYELTGQELRRKGHWAPVDGKGLAVFAPTLVAGGTGAWLVYAGEADGNWDIYAIECGPGGLGTRVRVTSDGAVDTDPAAFWRDGVLSVVWESNRNGFRQVFTSTVRDGRASTPVALSQTGISSFDPAIAVTDDDRAAVAWHSFADNNYDVYLSQASAEGSWGKPRRLTRASGIDRHARLFMRGSELWVAFEHAGMQSYSIGGTTGRHLVVGRVTADGLDVPPSRGGAKPSALAGEAVTATFDAAGRLWLAFTRGNSRDWNLLLTHFDGETWGRVEPVTTLKGMDRRPGLVVDGGLAVLAFQADTLIGRYKSREESLAATSDVYFAVRDVSDETNTAAMRLERYVEPDEIFEPGDLRVQYGEDMPTPSTEYKGQTLKLFYGDLHDHTDISICGRIRDESVDESYQNMRDVARHDFACATDHGYNLTPYLWHYTAKMARLNTDRGRFIAFLGEEWTSTFEEYSDEHPYGFYGHRNLILADPYFPRWWNAQDRQTPTDLWKELREMKADFVQIPHQIADTGNVPVDWNHADEEAQPVAEIFQGRGSYEYLGAPRMAGRATPTKKYFIQDAWEKGVVIGVIASPDHGGGRGKACVWAPELTRKAILDAMRARHTFGTTAAKMVLDVRVNGALMGEKLPATDGKPVEVLMDIRCPGDIDRVEVCRNNEFIYSKSPEGREATLRFVDVNPLPGRSYYYVRVIQKDEEIGWTSPVWLGQ